MFHQSVRLVCRHHWSTLQPETYRYIHIYLQSADPLAPTGGAISGDLICSQVLLSRTTASHIADSKVELNGVIFHHFSRFPNHGKNIAKNKCQSRSKNSIKMLRKPGGKHPTKMQAENYNFRSQTRRPIPTFRGPFTGTWESVSHVPGNLAGRPCCGPLPGLLSGFQRFIIFIFKHFFLFGTDADHDGSGTFEGSTSKGRSLQFIEKQFKIRYEFGMHLVLIWKVFRMRNGVKKL